MRSGMFQAVSVNDVKAVAKQLVGVAKSGEVPAVKLLLDRLLGPPVALDFEERLKALEEKVKGAEQHASQT